MHAEKMQTRSVFRRSVKKQHWHLRHVLIPGHAHHKWQNWAYSRPSVTQRSMRQAACIKIKIKHPENTSQSTHKVFSKNGLSKTLLLITFDSYLLTRWSSSCKTPTSINLLCEILTRGIKRGSESNTHQPLPAKNNTLGVYVYGKFFV